MARSLITSLMHGVDELKNVLKKKAKARLATVWNKLEEENMKLRDEWLNMKKQLVTMTMHTSSMNEDVKALQEKV